VVCLGIGVVPVLVFTWMFEFTPQGFRRQAELDQAGIVVARSGRRFDYLIAVLLLVATAWLAWEWGARIRVAKEVAQAGREEVAAPAEALAPPNTLAVLPLLNLSTAPDSGVLADGIAEEILGVLGRNRGLRVTARSSAFQFKDQHRDLREVGRILGVRYLLEGSLRLASARVKVSTQLVDAASGVQLWSGSYERTLADLFALQEEIAEEVAKALQIVVAAQETTAAARGTASVEAHMELLRALQKGASRRVEDLDEAIGMLQRSLALDPRYAAAHVELAYAIYPRALQRGEDQAALPVITPLLDKALALNPRSGEARVLRGSLLMREDAAAAEAEIRAGLALAPSHARGYEMLAGHVGNDPARIDEALALIDQALALDPLSPRNHHMKGILLWHGKTDVGAARAHFARALEIEPRFRNALQFLVMPSMTAGEFAAAAEYAERLFESDPGDPQTRELLVLQYLNLGDFAAARAASEHATAISRVAVLAAEGDTAGALAQLRALDEVPAGLLGAALPPALALRHAARQGNWAEEAQWSMRGFGGTLIETAQPEAIAYPHWVALLRGAGRQAEADMLEAAALARLDRLDAQQWMSGLQLMFDWQRAMLYSGAGRRGEALDRLERAFQAPRPAWWLLLDGNPVFDPLREEPRFRALRARLDEQLRAERALLAEKRRARGADPAGIVPPAEG
jgi:TolB-like protein